MASLGQRWPFPILGHWNSLNNGHSTFTIDAATDQIEYIFRAEVALNIERLGYRYGIRTGTPVQHEISLQGVDGTGRADGTIKSSTNAKATFTPPADATANNLWFWNTLTSSYAASAGEDLAMVIKPVGTPDGSNNSSFAHTWGVIRTMSGHPYVVTVNAGTPTRLSFGTPCFAYGAAATVYGYPSQGNATVAVNSGSTPDEYGLRFLLDAGFGSTFKISGTRWGGNPAAASTFKHILYSVPTPGDYSVTSALQTSRSFDSDMFQSTSNQSADLPFDVSLSTLNFGGEYILAIQPQGAQNITPFYMETANVAEQAAWPHGGSCYWVERTDGGTWTPRTSRIPFIEPIISDWTEPSGGGGGPLIGGRLIGR